MDEWLSFSAFFLLLGTVSVFIMRLADHSRKRPNKTPASDDHLTESSESLSHSHLNDSSDYTKNELAGAD
jgi:hypothetical protein